MHFQSRTQTAVEASEAGAPTAATGAVLVCEFARECATPMLVLAFEEVRACSAATLGKQPSLLGLSMVEHVT